MSAKLIVSVCSKLVVASFVVGLFAVTAKAEIGRSKGSLDVDPGPQYYLFTVGECIRIAEVLFEEDMDYAMQITLPNNPNAVCTMWNNDYKEGDPRGTMYDDDGLPMLYTDAQQACIKYGEQITKIQQKFEDRINECWINGDHWIQSD